MLSGSLHARISILLAVGGNQDVHHIGRQGRIARPEANLNQQRARQGLHGEAAVQISPATRPGIGRRRIRVKIWKLAGKSAHESRRLVELEAGNHLPGSWSLPHTLARVSAAPARKEIDAEPNDSGASRLSAEPARCANATLALAHID